MQYAKASCCFGQQPLHPQSPIISQSSLKTPHPNNPHPHPHPLIHTHRTSRNTITSLSLLVWEKGEALWNSPTRWLPPLSQRGEMGPWCSRSTRLSQGCTPPLCWGTRCHRIRPRHRWFHPAWQHPRCCGKMSCCPASSTHCAWGRTPPHSGAHGSHRNRRRQTVCLDGERR